MPRLLLSAVLALLVGVPAASAATTVAVSGGVLTVTGDAGPNFITVTSAGGNFSVAGADTAGAGCTGAGPVTCPTAGVASITATLGDEVDRWDSGTIDLPTSVDLGKGFDLPFLFQSASTGNGDDHITGGPQAESDIGTRGGKDTINLGGGDDATVPGPVTGGTLDAGPGDDTIDLGDGNDGSPNPALAIQPGAGNDTVTLGSGNDRNVNDLVVGNTGNDTISGGPGNDSLLNGADGDDTIDGGPGNDSALTGGPGKDTVSGGPDEDSLTTEADDGADTVDGGPGDDTITIDLAFPGFPVPVDTVKGGAGRDEVAAFTTLAVSMSINGTGDDGYRSGLPSADIGPDVEVLTGSSDADVLSGGAGAVTLNGNAGADVLTGGSGNDRLNGGAGGDALTGGAGDDVLGGAQGDDILAGGDGNDLLAGGGGADVIGGGAGTDTGDWSTALGSVSLTPGAAADDGESGEGDTLGTDVENLVGGPFNDAITGGQGRSVLWGGGGDDVIAADDGAADVVACGAGDDSVKADAIDALETSGTERCERIDQPPVVIPVTPLPTLKLAGKVSKARKVKVTLTCPVAASGDVRILDAKGEPLTRRASFTCPVGKAVTVTLALNGDGRAALKKRKSAAAVIRADVAGTGDAFRRAEQKVTLKR